MQVADIISWSLGQICMLSQKGSSSVCVCVCSCVCVCLSSAQERGEKNKASIGEKLFYSLWFQTNRKGF